MDTFLFPVRAFNLRSLGLMHKVYVKTNKYKHIEIYFTIYDF